MNRESTCLLCGDTSRDVKPLNTCWTKPSSSEYSVIPRCSKTDECYERVLRNGEEWVARPPQNYEVIRARVGDPLPMPEVRRA